MGAEISSTAHGPSFKPRAVVKHAALATRSQKPRWPTKSTRKRKGLRSSCGIAQ
jgi:hypothetical protein